MIQSRLPVSKKRRERKEKTSTSPSKTRGEKKENFIFPCMSLSLFSLPPAIFFPLFSPALFHLYPRSLSIFLCFFLLLFFHRPIILSPSVSLRHVFQGLPSIDTVSTNSSPPVPSKEPHGDGGELGEGLWGRPAGYVVIRLSWRGGHEPSYLIITVAGSGQTLKGETQPMSSTPESETSGSRVSENRV